MQRPELPSWDTRGTLFYDGTYHDSQKIQCLMTSYGALHITHDPAKDQATFRLSERANRGMTTVDIHADTIAVRKHMTPGLPQSQIASIYNRDLQLTSTTCTQIPLSHTDGHPYAPTFYEFLVTLTIEGTSIKGWYIKSQFRGMDTTPIQIKAHLSPITSGWDNMTVTGDRAVLASTTDNEKTRNIMIALQEFTQPCMDLVIPQTVPVSTQTWWQWYHHPYDQQGTEIARAISALSPRVIQ